MLTIHSEK